MITKDGGAQNADLEPMTPEQCAYLKELAGRAADPDAFGPALSRAEAARRILALEEKLARERHAGKERLPAT